MGDNQHRRIDFVDLTKGVCIILVVMAPFRKQLD